MAIRKRTGKGVRAAKKRTPAKLPKPSVATITVKEATRQPVRVSALANPRPVVRPRRIRRRRFPARVPEGKDLKIFSTTRPLSALASLAAKALSPSDDVRVTRSTPLKAAATKATASNVGEPSVAVNGNVVVYTGNWYAAVSKNRGKTFRYIDPSTEFQEFDPPGSSFCCDQVVHYIPKIDTFVWLLQYGTDSEVDNFQRLAFARTADVAANRWRLFDLSAQSLGVAGMFIDFPDLAVGANSLYMTTNIFPPDSGRTGCALVRIPFTSIEAGNLKADRFVTFDNDSLRVAQNCGATAFIASHETTSSLRIFSWPEGKAAPTSRTVDVSRWIGGDGYHSRTPDGRRWLDRADSRITGATLAGKELWFAWSVDRGSNKREKPFIQVARIDAGSFAVRDNMNIFDADCATCYPALATNADNEVGIAYFLGGGTRFPTLVVGFLTGSRRELHVVESQRGPLEEEDGTHHWGDYLAVRRAFPDEKLFAASGYTMRGKGSGNGENTDCTPQFVIFGRKKNT